MILPSYIVSRGKGGILQLRVPVPRGLQSIVGLRERIQSLRTSDRKLASERAVPILAQWRAQWAAAAGEAIGLTAADRSAATTSTAGLDAIATKWGYEFLLEMYERDRQAMAGVTDDGWRAFLAKKAASVEGRARQLATGNLSTIEDAVDRIAAREGLKIGRDDPEFASLRDRLAVASLDAMGVERRRIMGELDAGPTSALVKAERQRSASTAVSGETILDLYDAYAAWKCQPGRKQRRRAELFAKDRVTVELFAEFVGVDRAVGSITKNDARAFRDMLGQFPASRGKIAVLAKASIVECIEASRRDGRKLLSLTTQAKYLSIIAPLFDWLVSDGPRHLALDANVFDGLHPALDKGENRRPSYSTAQLNALIASPLFGRCGGDGAEHRIGEVEVRDHRYWIPLLCMFTGSRITEIAQLHVDDVAMKDGVPLVFLTHDEASGRRIKNKQSRIAALHDHLIDAGFLDYWERQRERSGRDRNVQLFPELKVRAADPLGASTARWFSRYLTRIGIKDGADGYGAHSFRHTMSDAMRDAGFIDIEFGQLVLGHSNNTITSDYGSLPQGTPARLKAMVDAAFRSKPFTGVQFEGLRTPQPAHSG